MVNLTFSLYDVLIVALIVLVVFLIVCLFNVIQILRSLRDTVTANIKPIEQIISDVSLITNDVVTLEQKVKNFIRDIIFQVFTHNKGKEEKEADNS